MRGKRKNKTVKHISHHCSWTGWCHNPQDLLSLQQDPEQYLRFELVIIQYPIFSCNNICLLRKKLKVDQIILLAAITKKMKMFPALLLTLFYIFIRILLHWIGKAGRMVTRGSLLTLYRALNRTGSTLHPPIIFFAFLFFPRELLVLNFNPLFTSVHNVLVVLLYNKYNLGSCTYYVITDGGGCLAKWLQCYLGVGQ